MGTNLLFFLQPCEITLKVGACCLTLSAVPITSSCSQSCMDGMGQKETERHLPLPFALSPCREERAAVGRGAWLGTSCLASHVANRPKSRRGPGAGAQLKRPGSKSSLCRGAEAHSEHPAGADGERQGWEGGSSHSLAGSLFCSHLASPAMWLPRLSAPATPARHCSVPNSFPPTLPARVAPPPPTERLPRTTLQSHCGAGAHTTCSSGAHRDTLDTYSTTNLHSAVLAAGPPGHLSGERLAWNLGRGGGDLAFISCSGQLSAVPFSFPCKHFHSPPRCSSPAPRTAVLKFAFGPH